MDNMEKYTGTQIEHASDRVTDDFNNLGIDNIKHEAAADDDIALELVKDATHSSLSPEETRRVTRKIDFFLMPLLFITFGLQYVDKILLTGAAQFGIIQDLDLYTVAGINPKTHEPILDLNRYSNVTLIFYWGALAALLPASWLLQRLPIGRYIAYTVIVWGVIIMLTVVVQGYHAFLVQRFFLGVAECSVPTGCSLIIAMWWRRDEQPLRYSMWYTSQGLGGLLGFIVMYGIGHIYGSLSSWKYLYLILGSITILWGVLLLFLLPDNPVSARFLKPDERVTAVERMRSEQIGIENKRFKPRQIKEALLDPKTWILFVMTFCLQFVNGGVSGFVTVIVNSMGYSKFQAVLIGGSVGAGVFVMCVLTGVVATVVKNIRTYLVVFTEAMTIAGACLIWKLNWNSQRGGALFGFIFCGWFAACYTMVLALAFANTSGYTKKAFTSGIIWCGWGISNGVSPLTVKTTEVAQHYPTCFLAVVITGAITIICAIVLRVYLHWENRTRDRKYGLVDPHAAMQLAFHDKTDMENTLFRYSL